MPTPRSSRLASCAAAAALFALAACGDDGPTPTDTIAGDTITDTAGDTTGDTVTPPDPAAIFAFGVDPAQTISAAPFPNDLYLQGGAVSLAPLGDDPRFATLAVAEARERLDGLIADKDGFGFNTAVFFPMAADADLASFADRVHLVTLDGPEAGRAVATEVFWYPEASYLGVIAAFGDYQLPGSAYAVLIEAGVTAAGVPAEAPASFAAMLGPDAPESVAGAALHASFAPVRAWLADAGRDPADFVIGTVYTTEDTVSHAARVIAAVDAWPLTPPTRRVAWDADEEAFIEAPVITADSAGADLDAYFGVASGDFALQPGAWGSGNRAEAATYTGGARYDGGSFRGAIDRVVNGTLALPAFHYAIEGGAIVNRPFRFDTGGDLVAGLTELVQFTLFLCADTGTADLPVAIATHGGTAQRSDMLGFAAANCAEGVATIAIDLPFHSGRIAVALLDDGATAASVRLDAANNYTGLTADDAGFVPDYVGDNGGITDTVGPLFALPQNVHPAVVAANTLQISADNHAVARYLADADWSGVLEGLSFDGDAIFHQSLSFGSSFTTMSIAMSDAFRGVVSSVASGRMLSSNLPIAPANGLVAAGFMRAVLGLLTPLERVTAAAWQDPVVSLLQWLAQRGDPLGYAPFVLRHRPSGAPVSLLSSGNSWDETLFGPAQLSMHNAIGLEAFTDGAPWTLDPTVPGAALVSATPWVDAPVSANVTFGDTTHSAGTFFLAEACHTLAITPFCVQRHEQPHPPIVPLEDPVFFDSPICAIHGQIGAFLRSLLDGDGLGDITPPRASCEDIYGD